MNINRHNYETYFLLYVDKELSAAERKAVDVFVQENPDLQMELSLLQQTVIKSDGIVLDKKDWLYMEEEITPLLENLLLYADDELNGAGKKTVEALLVKDKQAQTEWAVLQQTILQPDMSVVFADKQSLYRKEPARVVAFKWWRVAAAAILLIISLWTGISIYKNAGTPKPDFVKNKNTSPDKKVPNSTPGNTTVTNQPEEKSTVENITTTTAQKNKEDQPGENYMPVVEKAYEQNTISSKKNITVQNNNKKSDNNLPNPALQNINKGVSNETTVQNVLPSNSNGNKVSGNKEAVVTLTPKENKSIVENVSTDKTDPNITAIAVVNTNGADNEKYNNRYLNVDDDKHKRSTLGGFLRKAKRVLERNTNVKTGDGIKIAGFEIALK